MSGSYYQLNQKYNQLLALIAAGGGGGGGSVSNPMTSDLNGGGYDIVNVDAVNAISFAGTTMTANRVSAADLLTATNFNETDAPYYNNLGAITNTGTGKYQIAQVPVAADAECSTLCVLRALDSGLKHQVFFSIMAYEDKATIVVLNNVAESDTPVFGQITYGEDIAGGGVNTLSFTCFTPSATCEFAVFQNQGQNGGAGSYGSTFQFASGAVPADHLLVYQNAELTLNTVQTTGNMRVEGGLYALDTDTKSLQANEIATLTFPDIAFLNNVDFQTTNSVKNAFAVQTDSLGATTVGGAINTTSDVNFNNNTLFNALDDFVYFGDNIDLQGASLYNVNTLVGAGGGASDINVNCPFLQLGGNNIEGVNSIAVDTIFESSAGNGVILGNEIKMGNNKISSLGGPTANADAATKLYVDTVAGSSGVQNPMVATLDGGGQNINNVNSFAANTIANDPAGNLLSNGFFAHGGVSATTFGVGGTEITFAPSASLKIKNFGLSNTYFDYDQATQTLTTENGARQELAGGALMEVKAGASISVATGGIIDASVGGAILLNQTAAPPTSGLGELNILDIQGAGRDGVLQANTLIGGGVIPSAFGCSTTVNKRLDATVLPFTFGGTGWDSSNDGDLIRFNDSDSLIFKEGLPAGINNHDNNPIVFEGWIVGIGANNGSNLGGWICSGGASIEVISSSAGAFPIPVILGQAGQAFNSENRIIPQAGWIRADNPQLGGQQLALRLNIPAGDTIDIQDVANAGVNLNCVILQQIPIV